LAVDRHTRAGADVCRQNRPGPPPTPAATGSVIEGAKLVVRTLRTSKDFRDSGPRDRPERDGRRRVTRLRSPDAFDRNTTTPFFVGGIDSGIRAKSLRPRDYTGLYYHVLTINISGFCLCDGYKFPGIPHTCRSFLPLPPSRPVCAARAAWCWPRMPPFGR